MSELTSETILFHGEKRSLWIMKGTYKNNAENRRLGRVGNKYGGKKVTKKTSTYAEGGEIKVIGNKIIISDENDNEYVYRHFLKEDKHYLIPYIDTKSRSKEYWEHHFIPKDTWVDIENIDFNDYNITKEQFDSIKNKGLQKKKEILSKYHSSFAKGGSIKSMI